MSAAPAPPVSTVSAVSDSMGAGTNADDLRFMDEALCLAAEAAAAGEVPVGAVVVRQGQVVGRGHNAPIGRSDPSAHAEVVALRDAAARLGNYRLGDCTLYTTLEPCAMCAGAIQHARISRLVFGAHDAKAGAAGSVVDLFANPRLNAHTHVESGVRAEEGAQLLTQFFAQRRAASPPAWPLREDALRTPSARFAELPDFPWPTQYVSDLPGLDGLRLAYLDEGPSQATRSWLCLHDHHAWGYAFRHLTASWLAQGDRVVAPDWIGFGRSDKPKRRHWHRPEQHRDILLALIDRLNLERFVVVLQSAHAEGRHSVLKQAPSGALGLAVLQEPAVCGADTPPLGRHAAQQAPFPDAGHQAGPLAWSHWASEQPTAPTQAPVYTYPGPMMQPDAPSPTRAQAHELALQMRRDTATAP